MEWASNASQPFSPEDCKVFTPYVPKVSEKLQQIGRNNGFQYIATKAETLGSRLQYRDQPYPVCERKNVIYKIPCFECSKTYIGTTKQKVRCRFSSHRSNIKLKNNNNSLYVHQLETGHSINFDEAKIIAQETHFGARMNLEAFHILKEEGNIMNHILPQRYDLLEWVKMYK